MRLDCAQYFCSYTQSARQRQPRPCTFAPLSSPSLGLGLGVPSPDPNDSEMPIVYDGVNANADDKGEENGGLFRGIRFWIAHRVPMRETFVRLVQNNGGEVVRLEKLAHMLIADHARRGVAAPPPGSYSWKWIEDSVTAGALENKDQYLIGRSEDSPRKAGAAEQAKSSRTPFTENDDLILTKWVLNKGASSGGMATNGNAIYQELERRHPQHTWQSWRNRWVKTLRDKTGGMALFDRGDDTPSPPSGPAPAFKALDEDEPQASILVASSPPREQPKSAPSESAARPKRMPFTPEEDNLLIAYVREANLEQRAIKGNEIYKEFAIQHNSHPWQSWRDRWIKHLSHIPTEDAGIPRAAASESSPGDFQLKSIAVAARALYQEARPEKPATSGAHGPGSTQRNAKTDDERLQMHNQERLQNVAAKMLQRTWRGYTERRDYAKLKTAVVPLQSIMRGYLLRSSEATVVLLQAMIRGHLVRMTLTEEFPDVMSAVTRSYHVKNMTQEVSGLIPEIDEDQPDNMIQDVIEAKTTMEDDDEVSDKAEDVAEIAPKVDGNDQVVNSSQYNENPDATTIAMTQSADVERNRFFEDLRDYAEVSDRIIDMQPVICARNIDLWHLFRAATRSGNHSESRDWYRIAKDLGYQNEKHHDAARQLQTFFDQNLADFEEAIKAFDNADGVVEEFNEQGPYDDHSDTSSAVLPDRDIILDSGRSPSLQSSPSVARYKRHRQYEELITSDLSYPPSGLKKRRRLDSDSVIPSTPEEKLRLLGKHDPQRKVHEESSPLKSRVNVEQLSGDNIVDEGSDGGIPVDMQEAEVVVNTQAQSLPEQRIHDQGQNALDEQHVRSSIETDGTTLFQQRQLRFDHHPGQERFAEEGETHFRQDRSRPPSTSTVHRLPNDSLDRIAVASRPHNDFSSRIAASVKATKRTLPAPYFHRQTSSTITPTPAPKPSESFHLHARHSLEASTKRTNIPRTATAYEQGVSSRLSRTLTPTPAMQRPSPRAAVPSATKGQYTDEARSNTTARSMKIDEVYVENVFKHFKRLGYAESDITVAQDATSCEPRLMTAVLESLANGRPIPEDEPGIWANADMQEMYMIIKYQRRLENGKETEGPGMNDRARVRIWQARNRLEAKHGEAALERRIQFLQSMQR
ncbi:Rap1 Myb domain-domain-containing protein [Coniella lustricola]|uniref:Telomeric repeat-binding factor 2-interacting protein 1 n=1 Tax=Coniella lustricola TaxID=2025994 RepID=A0A2T3AM02_9PEZI|nr:Rap1 Myb domain-domain-containing protein [Coniella lustricola]